MNVARDDLHQVPATFSCEDRRRINGGKDALSAERFRQKCAGMDAIANVDDVPAQYWVFDLRLQQIQRAQYGQPGADQSDKLLVKENKVIRLDLCSTSPL